jgi:hypothetical protein
MDELEEIEASFPESHATRLLEVLSTSLVDYVWVGHYVGYDLAISHGHLFVVYYDADLNMSVASKPIDGSTWLKTVLPSQLTWDSHRSLNIGIDSKGFIHICGNMHVTPLLYFRSDAPLDCRSMLELNFMLGNNEDKVTYPRFFRDLNHRLYFSYRAGTCGNGNTFINSYDVATQSWNRTSEKAFLQGRPVKKSAYYRHCLDRDNTFHFTWMWRTNPLVETCHQLCYASSKDMNNWVNSEGNEIKGPFRPDDPRVIIDDVPEKGGLHNSHFEIIADWQGCPIVVYTKFDLESFSQLFIAKLVNNKWITKQLSSWRSKWEFEGQGDTMRAGVSFRILGFSDRTIVIVARSPAGEEAIYYVNADSLVRENREMALDTVYPNRRYAQPLSEAIDGHSNTFLNLMPSTFSDSNSDSHYLLKWYSRGRSHGNKAPESMPRGPISQLHFLEVKNRDNN